MNSKEQELWWLEQQLNMTVNTEQEQYFKEIAEGILG